jgi:hypothetical protein
VETRVSGGGMLLSRRQLGFHSVSPSPFLAPVGADIEKPPWTSTWRALYFTQPNSKHSSKGMLLPIRTPQITSSQSDLSQFSQVIVRPVCAGSDRKPPGAGHRAEQAAGGGPERPRPGARAAGALRAAGEGTRRGGRERRRG